MKGKDEILAQLSNATFGEADLKVEVEAARNRLKEVEAASNRVVGDASANNVAIAAAAVAAAQERARRQAEADERRVQMRDQKTPK